MYLNKISFFLIAATVILSGCVDTQDGPESYHVHADFAVILDGQQFDFNKTQFMSTPFEERSPNVHLHDFNPFVIHLHNSNATLGEFFESIGMAISNECFDTGTTEYCTSNEKKLQVFANKQPIQGPHNYKPADLDKILVFFGEGNPTDADFNKITGQACMYSEKCPLPPGVVLPPESCTISKPCELPQ